MHNMPHHHSPRGTKNVGAALAESWLWHRAAHGRCRDGAVNPPPVLLQSEWAGQPHSLARHKAVAAHMGCSGAPHSRQQCSYIQHAAALAAVCSAEQLAMCWCMLNIGALLPTVGCTAAPHVGCHSLMPG